MFGSSSGALRTFPALGWIGPDGGNLGFRDSASGQTIPTVRSATALAENVAPSVVMNKAANGSFCHCVYRTPVQSL
jgi:hypothetical protein